MRHPPEPDKRTRPENEWTKLSAVAEIRWIPEELGGRKSPPNLGAAYSTLARFAHESDSHYEQNSWSLVLDMLDAPGPDLRQRAAVRFLVDCAPENWLVPGARFALFEGKRRVADGVILD